MRVYMFICGFVCMEKLIICGWEKILYLSQYEFESCIPLNAKNSNLHYFVYILLVSIHLSNVDQLFSWNWFYLKQRFIICTRNMFVMLLYSKYQSIWNWPFSKFCLLKTQNHLYMMWSCFESNVRNILYSEL